MSDGDTEPVYEWDAAKRRSNIAKHGVDFTEMTPFAWDTAAEILDDRYEEPRWITIGFIGTRLHVAVYYCAERNYPRHRLAQGQPAGGEELWQKAPRQLT